MNNKKKKKKKKNINQMMNQITNMKKKIEQLKLIKKIKDNISKKKM
jgi:hypothetical protein